MGYSQNNEERVILDYFKNFTGTLLSVGENDGKTLSNSLALIERGWSAALVEPAPAAFLPLVQLHETNKNVFCYGVAISDKNGLETLYESGTHLNKDDKALLSSTIKSEINKWKASTEFQEVKVQCYDFKTFMDNCVFKTFDFISIDAEGCDLMILKQINLSELKCKAICIEHNSDSLVLSQIRGICAKFGLKNELLRNAENVIISI